MERMRLQLFLRHSKVEVGYGFPEYRAPSLADNLQPSGALPIGVPSLVITQAHDFPNSVAYDVVGTDSGVKRFVDELRLEGLHARVHT